MPTTSGSISKTPFQTRLVIEHAYRRCRLTAQQITGEMIDVAMDLLYLMLSAWANDGIQLWCIEKQILPLYQGQAQLPCPLGTVDILNANLRTVTYQNFTAQATSTSILATLAIPDIISNGVNTNGIGITTFGSSWSDVALPYTIQARIDPALAWTTIGTVNPDTTNGIKTWQDFDAITPFKYYQATVIKPIISLSIAPSRMDTTIYVDDPTDADLSRYFLNAKTFTLPKESVTFTVQSATYDAENRFTIVTFSPPLAQVNNAVGDLVGYTPTLAISNWYLCNNPYEITIARLNRDDYINLPNKTFQGRPLQYWYDRQRDIPIMTLWPAPDTAATLNQIIIWRKRYIMDVGAINDVLDIPQRWYDAVVYNLAMRLSEERPEVDPQLMPVLNARAQVALANARMEERDNSPIYWSPNLRVYTQ